MHSPEEQRLLTHLREDIEQISAAASHDLRDQLREAMRLCEELREVSGHEASFCISRIQMCIQDTMDNVAALRQYAYLAQNLEKPRSVALEDILRRVEERFAAHLAARRARITWNRQMHLPLVARPAQLELMFQHLVDNGLKYNHNISPEVRIEIEPVAEGYACSVTDNGDGMEPEFAYLVFGLFKRINPQGPVKGCGAGLAFSKKVAENHGGTIALESEPGYGCRITVTLPQPQADTALPAQGAVAVRPS